MSTAKVRLPALFLLFALILPLVQGCQTIREVANLRNVRFQLDRVSGARLAGVDLNRIRSYSDLSRTDLLRLTASLVDGKLPLAFQVHVRAENPAENNVLARMVKMDWSLLLDDKRTVTGVFNDEIVLQPGTPTDVPIAVELDLTEFFGNNMRELVDLALAVSGTDTTASTRIKLEATPTINTVLGPIRYPRPVTIVSRQVGGSAMN